MANHHQSRPRRGGRPMTDRHETTGTDDPGVLFWLTFVALCVVVIVLTTTCGPLDPLGLLDSEAMTGPTSEVHP